MVSIKGNQRTPICGLIFSSNLHPPDTVKIQSRRNSVDFSEEASTCKTFRGAKWAVGRSFPVFLGRLHELFVNFQFLLVLHLIFCTSCLYSKVKSTDIAPGLAFIFVSKYSKFSIWLKLSKRLSKICPETMANNHSSRPI